MATYSIIQIVTYLVILILCVKPLGWYFSRVYEGKSCGLDKIFRPIETAIYRFCHINPSEEMGWKHYLAAMLFLNFFGMLAVYLLLRLQIFFPLNPAEFGNVKPDLAFNIAGSFVTNTNWQAYGGESTLSYFTQMIALTVQNFLSAATGLSLFIAFTRSLTRKESHDLGNFWVDAVRSILYILLPLALLLAIALVSQGVVQTIKPYETIQLIEPVTLDVQPSMQHSSVTTQVIPLGPVASQVAIKQLGSNGGGFFNVNSAHPFENPTPFSNFLEMLAILLIPSALCYTFGKLVNDTRQGFALLVTMIILFIPSSFATVYFEQQSNPTLLSLPIDQTTTLHQSGGNMEGKETRFGITSSALWTTATTASSNGSVNSMLDSYTPSGNFIALIMMHFGEVIFGGVGSGLYNMLLIVIIAVFVTGLMVGRTPEYLGKKIEPFEMKMASIAVLLMPTFILLFTAIACTTSMGIQSIGNPGSHGFSEILYAFTSMGANNGSAMAGLNANTFFYNVLGGILMLFLRFWPAIALMAMAGSLVQKKAITSSAGTLPTHTPLFILLLISIILIIGTLSFFPALTLGPLVEHFMLWGQHGH